MAQTKRRYTTVDKATDYIVTATWNEKTLHKAQWFETKVEVVNEKTGEKMKLPKEIATYRVGEIEHDFRTFVALDFDSDREAAVRHLLDTMHRRVYSFIERGH